MSSQEIRERILAEALEELKEKAGEVINTIMKDLYTDYLPHVVDDTEANISYRVQGCLKNILQGKIQTTEYPNLFYVNDGYGNKHLVSLGDLTLDFKPLCDIMGETIQTNRIKQLESQVEDLKQQLQESYRRF